MPTDPHCTVLHCPTVNNIGETMKGTAVAAWSAGMMIMFADGHAAQHNVC